MTDCSWTCKFSTTKIQVQNMLCTKVVFCFDIQNNFCTQHVLNLYFSRTELVIPWTSYCGLSKWFKNECFWHRFTCNISLFPPATVLSLGFVLWEWGECRGAGCMWGLFVPRLLDAAARSWKKRLAVAGTYNSARGRYTVQWIKDVGPNSYLP